MFSFLSVYCRPVGNFKIKACFFNEKTRNTRTQNIILLLGTCLKLVRKVLDFSAVIKLGKVFER
jgi:hypothetical protein